MRIGQHAYTFWQGASKLHYLLYLPPEYGQDPEKKWPLIYFLHGISKCGNTLDDLELLKQVGPSMLVEEQSDFPFIVLSPQCPSDTHWSGEIDQLDALLSDIISGYAVDTSHIYLTGLSMGGFGTWNYILQHQERFAAAAPICGGYIFESDEVPDNICDLKDFPIWTFHGGRDDVVLPQQTEVLVDALKACNGNVKFTFYPDADHDSWTRTYENPELYTWFLEQTR